VTDVAATDADSAADGTGDTAVSTRRRLLTRAGGLGAATVVAAVAEGLAPQAARADSYPTPVSLETSFQGGVAVSDSGSASAQHWFTLGPRQTSLLNFPVPSVRPVASNQGTALDLMPNGTAPNNPGNGYTWIDVCDTDVYVANPAVTTARIGIFPDHIEFGSRGFNGLSGKPIWITANGNGTSTPQILISPGSPGSIAVGSDGSAVSIPSSVAVGGSTVTATPMTVRANTSTVVVIVNHSAPSSTGGAGIIGRSYTSPPAAGQRLGYFLFGGDQAQANTAGMSGWSAEAWQNGARLGTYLAFETTAVGTTTRLERLRIGSDGVLRLPNADASPSTKPPSGTGCERLSDG
jgi:hypothetical protein